MSPPGPGTVSRRQPLAIVARRGWLVLVAVAVFLTVGVPRWLAGDVAPPATRARANFTKLCRQHGGTPAGGSQPVCTVRYGHNTYRTDAITPTGFDQDAADYQRRGCQQARREQQRSGGHRRRRPAFIYHPTAGVCELRR